MLKRQMRGLAGNKPEVWAGADLHLLCGGAVDRLELDTRMALEVFNTDWCFLSGVEVANMDDLFIFC